MFPIPSIRLLAVLLLSLVCAVPVGAREPVEVSGTLRVDQPVRLSFELGEDALPAGASAAVNVDFPGRPEGARPQVRSGYPHTVVFFRAAGEYRLHVTVHRISKPSCGGVDAEELLDTELDLSVGP